jgi:hypothetical protein
MRDILPIIGSRKAGITLRFVHLGAAYRITSSAWKRSVTNIEEQEGIENHEKN